MTNVKDNPKYLQGFRVGMSAGLGLLRARLSYWGSNAEDKKAFDRGVLDAREVAPRYDENDRAWKNGLIDGIRSVEQDQPRHTSRKEVYLDGYKEGRNLALNSLL